MAPFENNEHVVDNNQHKIDLIHGLNLLRKSHDLCDVFLLIDSQKIAAHKAVLASFSPYFKTMFTSRLVERDRLEVPMQGVNFRAVQLLIEYAYTGYIIVNEHNVQDLLAASDLLQLPQVVEECCKYLKSQLHPCNCIGFARFAKKFSCFDLHDTCQQYILENFYAIIKHEEFKTLVEDELIDILSNTNLCLSSEATALKAVNIWVKYNNDSQMNLLKLIRFQNLSVKVLQCLKDSDNIPSEIQGKIHNALLLRLGKQHISNALSQSFPDKRPCPKSLFIGGGIGIRKRSTESVALFNPDSEVWTEMPSLPQRRIECAAVSIGHMVYVIGGKVSHVEMNGLVTHNQENSMIAFDLNTNKWVTCANMHKKRSAMGAVVFQDNIFVVGGYDGNEYLRSVERYIPYKNKWKLCEDMKFCKSCLGVGVVEDELYCIGGYGPSCLNQWAADPPSNLHIGSDSLT